MVEKHRRRGLNLKTLLVAICATGFITSSNIAIAANTNHTTEYSIDQQKTLIKGQVKDASGEPVIGASILEKGTSNGTITDIDGNFSINVKPGATLQISYIGFKAIETKAQNNLKITLKEDSELLDEVVVVGYGAQKKENLTGAVASVDIEKTLGGRPVSDVGRGLQGTTPGLSIAVPSGELGSDPTIKIRGQIGSLDGGSSPLILLDNVEIPSLQMVNSDDIESISVLKDAASASIYGAKGAFGVILITTKKGAKTESVNVSYSGTFSWQNISKKMDMARLNGLEYSIDASKRVKGPGAAVSGAFFQMTEEGLELAREWDKNYGGKLGPNDPMVYGRDWYVDSQKRKIGLRTYDPYDYMIREWAPSMTHNLSLNGKSGKTTYNVGLGYLDQDGINKPAKKDDFKRYNASIKLSTEINKYVTVRAGAIYSKREKRYAYSTSSTTADQWLYLYRWGSNMPLGYDDEGDIIRSPHSELSQANTAKREWNYTNINLGATFNIMKDWTLDVDYTYAGEDNIINEGGTRYTALQSWGGAIPKLDSNGNQIYVDNTGAVVDSGTPGAMPAQKLSLVEYTSHGSNPDHIYRRVANGKRKTLNIVTNYNLELSELHKFKFMAGMNRVTYDETYNWSRKKDLTDITNPQFDLAVGQQESSGGNIWDGQLGFFGRINYSFANKYLLEANIRYDGTSKFPKDLRWRAFPSFSAGWILSEESWMDWSKSILSFFKVRGSWGMIGDQTVPNTLYTSFLPIGESSWLDYSGQKLTYTGIPSAIDANISWQDITTLNLGLDTRFLDGELGLSFDWYQRDTKNMIVPSEVSYSFGQGAPKGNYGSLRSRGWELAIDYNHRFENGLGVNAMVTLSDAQTEITKYSDTKSINDWYVGKKYGEIWGYATDRLYQKDDFIYNGDKIEQTYALNGKEVAKGTPGAKIVNKLKDPNAIYQDYLQSGDFIFGPGDVKFKDLDGDGKIDSGSNSIDNAGDRKVIGNSTPRYEYGIRLGADFKGFDFSIFMQGVGKRQVWGNGFLAIPGYNSSDGAMPETFAKDYWKEDRPNAYYPRPFNQSGNNDKYNMVQQSKYLLDMSYFRIKNITLGYTLPMHITSKVKMQKARVYLALENFFTFDNLRGLPIDPEEVQGFSMFNSDNYNSGRTGVGAPTFKNVSFGVQLNF